MGKQIILRTKVIITQNQLLLIFLIHFTVICVLEVAYIYYICMMEILHNALPNATSWLVARNGLWGEYLHSGNGQYCNSGLPLPFGNQTIKYLPAQHH